MATSGRMVVLSRPSFDVPWGFRLQGGIDQGKPLTVLRVNGGSVAESSGLRVGDCFLQIGDINTSRLTLSSAMGLVKDAGDFIKILISRSGDVQSSTQCDSRSPYNRVDQRSPARTSLNAVGRSPGRSPAPSHLMNPVTSPTASQYMSPVLSPTSIHRMNPVTSPVTARHNNYGTTQIGQQPHISRLRQTQPLNPPAQGVYSSPSRIPHEASLSPVRMTDAHARDSSYSPMRMPNAHAQPVSSSPARQMPDVVLNMTARGAPENKPWAYAPDKHVIEEQSKRIRRNLIRRNSNQSTKKQEFGISYNIPAQVTQKQEETREQNGGMYPAPAQKRGYHIPSKTFKMLQSATSGLENRDNSSLSLATERRRRRRYAQKPADNANEAVENGVRDFDEAAYLSGQIPILGGRKQSSRRPFFVPAYSHTNQKETGSKEDENKKPFDERAYLAGRIPLVTGGEIDPARFNVSEPVAIKDEEEEKPQTNEPFDENAYLAGKINILGGPSSDRPQNITDVKLPVEPPKPTWCKSDQEMVSEDEYDEDSFLRGRIPIVRRSVDRDIPIRPLLPRNPVQKVRASWELPADSVDNWPLPPTSDDLDRGVLSETEFDERAFLAGKWHRRGSDLRGYATDSEGEIPSRTFRILRRSVSSDRSAESEPAARVRGSGSQHPSKASQSYSEDDLYDLNDEKPYQTLIYSGRKIPSKAFSRLEKTMARKTSYDLRKSTDPIERLKAKTMDEGIDVDEAMEKLEIGTHEPDAYLELLKKSVEQKNIRIHADNETTDF